MDHAMQTQLVERYLKDNSCRQGLYLVGWYHCAQWDIEDRKHTHPWSGSESAAATIQDAKKKFDDQARSLTVGDLRLESFVIDASLR